jgi:hypothetical protein
LKKPGQKGGVPALPRLPLFFSAPFVLGLPYIHADSNLASLLNQFFSVSGRQLAAFHQAFDLMGEGMQ